MLTAIEDFLKRTEDYAWPPGPAAAVASTTVREPLKTTSIGPAEGGRRDASAEEVGQDGRAPLDFVGHSASADRTSAVGEVGQRREVLSAAVANTQVALNERQPTVPIPALPVLQSVSIHTAAERVAEPEEPTPSSTSNQPLDVRLDDAAVSADRFLEQLETQAKESNDLDSLWRLLLAQVAMNRITEPPAPTSSLSSEAQGILGGLIRLIVSARSAARNPLLIGERALRRADEFRQLLADRADPEIAAVALCRKVVTFGVYEEMDDEEFVAGRSAQTIVYSEIHNLRSEQTPDGKFRTLLATRLEVLTEDGQSVWQHEEPEIQDLCRRRRTDFFIAQRIILPATMGEGNYILKVFAEDKLSGKANEATHKFTVRSPLSLASNH